MHLGAPIDPALKRRPVSGTEVRVVTDGEPAAPGVVGRVELRRTAGPAYRYLGREAPEPGAWDTLGDDGFLDADGYLHLVDRAADRIQRAGTVVAPAEVEQALERNPAVRSAVAVGVADAVLGERIHAVVDVADSTLGVAELLAWARAEADPAPDSLELAHRPLRDDAGKVRRSAFRPDPAGPDRRARTDDAG